MRISDWRSDVCASDLILDRLQLGRLLDAPADDVEVDLELRIRHAAGVRDHHLLDLGPRCVRLFTDDLRVHRHLAPAVNAIAEVEDLALDQHAAAPLRTEIGARQEHHPNGERLLAPLVPGTRTVPTEAVMRDRESGSRACGEREG